MSHLLLKYRIGEHITTTTSEGTHTDIQVSKIIMHPQFSISTPNNDIALLKLSTIINYGTYVQPICLPEQDHSVPVGTECYITGKFSSISFIYCVLPGGGWISLPNGDVSFLGIVFNSCSVARYQKRQSFQSWL